MRVIAILISLIFFSCKNENSNEWGTIKIDKKISTNPIYTQMNAQKESYSFGITDRTSDRKHDTTLRKTSQVTIYQISDANSDIYAYNQFICKATYFKNIEEIRINIGTGGPFGGSGFSLITNKNKFKAEPYYWNDSPDPRQKPSKFQILKQELILDKSKYQIGDSLFGKIYYHIIETKSFPDDNEINKTEHVAQGYFRTQVEKEDPNAEAARLRN
jgi:hypothetical protein